MAFRRPLKPEGTNLKEMTDLELETVRDYLTYALGYSISIGSNFYNTLQYVSSSGNLGSLTDSRLRSGTKSGSATSFPSEATTSEPDVVNTSFARISAGDNAGGFAEPSDTNNIRWPLYSDSGNIRAMSTQDVLDTFIENAISTYVATASAQGQYRIYTSASLSGYTAMSTNPVFSDTRADTSEFLASNIPSSSSTRLDIPETITNFYLLRKDVGSAPAFTSPVALTSTGGNVSEQMGRATVINQMPELMKWAHANHTGFRVKWRYSSNGSGTNLGNGMTDTRLNGAGNYQTLQVNNDDYRAMEFPNGTAVTQSTNFLRCYKD
jgi:hypothetical protein